jgi:transposase
MSFRLRPGHRVFVFADYVDLRAGFDKLAMIIREKMKSKLVDGDLYLFMGKNRKKLKAICYDGSGLLLIAKRLDNGCFMRLDKLESLEITVDELDTLLRGSVIKKTYFGEEVLTRRKESIMNNTHDSVAVRDQHRSDEAIRSMP